MLFGFSIGTLSLQGDVMELQGPDLKKKGLL
jgi:hypothetical protein